MGGPVGVARGLNEVGDLVSLTSKCEMLLEIA